MNMEGPYGLHGSRRMGIKDVPFYRADRERRKK
jgi:hypothetical protein